MTLLTLLDSQAHTTTQQTSGYPPQVKPEQKRSIDFQYTEDRTVKMKADIIRQENMSAFIGVDMERPQSSFISVNTGIEINHSISSHLDALVPANSSINVEAIAEVIMNMSLDANAIVVKEDTINLSISADIIRGDFTELSDISRISKLYKLKKINDTRRN